MQIPLGADDVRSVAFFTFWLVISTVGLWTATIGLYLAGERQLAHAQAEAEAADIHRTAQFDQISAQIEALDQSAHTAEESLFQTRRLADNAEITAQRQLRAYVNVRNAYVINVADRTARIVKVEIENFGQTPAHDVIFYASEHVREWPLETSLPPLPVGGRVSVKPLAPRCESILSIPVSMLSEWEEAQLQDGRAGIYAWGEITYLDIFGERQRTWFRFVCEGEVLPEGKMHATQEGNGCT